MNTFEESWAAALAADKRYWFRGADLADLEESIVRWRSCLESAGDDDMRLYAVRNNLARALTARYWTRYRLADLDEAVRILRETWRACPANLGAPVAVNLGAALRERARVTRDVKPLVEAIRVLRAAKNRAPASATGRIDNLIVSAQVIDQLAIAYRERYVLRKRKRYLRRAIAFHEEAMRRVERFPRPGAELLTGLPPPDTSTFFYNFGESLRLLAPRSRSRRIESLDRAAERIWEAVNRKADPVYLEAFAQSTVDFSRLTGDRRVEPTATSAYRMCCERGIRLAPATALTASRAWGRWAFERSRADKESSERALGEAVEAYSWGRRALEAITRIQVVRGDKATVLRAQSGFAGEAGFVLATAGRLPEAVEAVEASVARLIGDALQLGAHDLDGLTKLGRAELREQYVRSVDRIAAADPGDAPEKLAEVVQAIRQLPGYANFLAAPRLAEITELLDEQTRLVYLSASPWGGVALVVDSHARVGLRWIPGLTQRAVKDATLRMHRNLKSRSERRRRRAIDTVTRWLGDVLPVDLFEAAAESCTRLLIVPVGLVSALPLHAASFRLSSGRLFAFDFLPISFAPSAGALLATRRARTQRVNTALAVIDPCLEGGEVDVSALNDLVGSKHIEIAPSEANREQILRLMATHSVTHFACHGNAVLDDPEKSAVRLPNHERLTAGDLWSTQLEHTRLVVLASCESAISGTTLVDEAISLPSLLLQAGVGGILGTLWSVHDDCAAELISRFYSRLQVEDSDPANALRLAARDLLTTGQWSLADVSAFVCVGG